MTDGTYLTETEFQKIKKGFLETQNRWENLEIGQTVYLEGCFMEELFECKITDLDVPNRKAELYEIKNDKLHKGEKHFKTIDELAKRGVFFKDKIKNEREIISNEIQKFLDTNPSKSIIAFECAKIAEKYYKEKLKKFFGL